MAIYQIQEQTDLEIVLVPTTLETATDVTYDSHTFNEFFNAGTHESIWVSVVGWWGCGKALYYVNMPELLRRVERALAEFKEYCPPLTAEMLEGLGSKQSVFKERGFMFRPSKGIFVRWKAKPKKATM